MKNICTILIVWTTILYFMKGSYKRRSFLNCYSRIQIILKHTTFKNTYPAYIDVNIPSVDDFVVFDLFFHYMFPFHHTLLGYSENMRGIEFLNIKDIRNQKQPIPLHHV